jgi:hypothetical protein
VSGEAYFLLGAGFSRAISEKMPTLSDLREDVLQQLGYSADILQPFDDDLEQWMSYLSVDQPWLPAQENLRNKATFSDASVAVADAIERAERFALLNPLPLWLERLVATWFDTEATLVTFNYDTLIERAASEQRRLSNWGDIYGMPLNRRSPINHGLVMGAAMYTKLIPELFKLHGSTNWGFPGLESSASDPVTIMKADGRWGISSRPLEPVRAQRAAQYADLNQLIIPPTGTKGAFYSNRALQAQWRTAFNRLRSARSLTIIGYSFPPSDLGARHFVANALRPGLPVTVVDYSLKTVDRIKEFLGPNHEVSDFSGERAVEDYVDAMCGDVLTWGVQRSADGYYRPRLLVNRVEQSGGRFLGSTSETYESLSNDLNDYIAIEHPGLIDRSLENWNDGVFDQMPRSAITLIDPPSLS